MAPPAFEEPEEFQPTAAVGDYPSLRDLETSNLFSGVNHNFNIQRHLDARRLSYLEELRLKFNTMRKASGREDDVDFCLTFTQLVPGLSSVKKKESSKDQAVSVFMDLLVFSQAGFCELKQNKLKDMKAPKFEVLRIYKMT